MLPAIFANYFTVRNEVHSVNTRNSTKLNIMKVKTNYGKHTLRYTGAKLYNNLPSSITTLATVKSFTKCVKKELIDKY